MIFAYGKVDRKEIEAQTKLSLLQMSSAGYDGVDVDAATKAGVWVASAPTTETGNGESVAEHAVLLMLAVSRRLNEEGVGIHDRAQVPPKLELNRASSVKPSLTSTDAMAELMKSDALMAAFRQRMPIGRSATPEDIAGVIAFLASEDAVFVNGVILPVDGGFMLLTAGRISSRSWDKAEPKQTGQIDICLGRNKSAYDLSL